MALDHLGLLMWGGGAMRGGAPRPGLPRFPPPPRLPPPKPGPISNAGSGAGLRLIFGLVRGRKFGTRGRCFGGIRSLQAFLFLRRARCDRRRLVARAAGNILGRSLGTAASASPDLAAGAVGNRNGPQAPAATASGASTTPMIAGGGQARRSGASPDAHACWQVMRQHSQCRRGRHRGGMSGQQQQIARIGTRNKDHRAWRADKIQVRGTGQDRPRRR